MSDRKHSTPQRTRDLRVLAVACLGSAAVAVALYIILGWWVFG
jgi:hypothetical protein